MSIRGFMYSFAGAADVGTALNLAAPFLRGAGSRKPSNCRIAGLRFHVRGLLDGIEKKCESRLNEVLY